MRKIIATIAGAACLFCASAAQAGVFKLDFTVAGFGKGIFSNLSAPQDPISGSILFTAESLGAVVTSIDAIDLVIAGHIYTPLEIGVNFYGNGYVFGAIANGIGVTRAATDDFYLILSSSSNVFAYAHSGVFDTWVSRGVTATYTPQAEAIPEPASILLLLAGLGGVALLRRRHG